MRSMVEGAHLGTDREYEAKHRVQVLEHIACSNAHDVKAFSPQQRITRPVAARLVAETVSLPIDLDDQTVAKAGEIGGDPIRRKLAAELQAIRPSPERLPKQHFGQAHLSPQFACALYLLDRRLEDAWAPSTTQLR